MKKTKKALNKFNKIDVLINLAAIDPKIDKKKFMILTTLHLENL